MPAFIKPADHLSLPQVNQRYHQTSDAVEKTHWLVIRLLLMGKHSREVAEIVGVTVPWVRIIVSRYNKKGTKSLGDGRHHNPGKKAVLSTAQQAQLLYALKHESPPTGGLWTCWKIRDWIKQETATLVRVGTAWDYLQRLGYSLQLARPRHLQADLAAQEEFKKKSA